MIELPLAEMNRAVNGSEFLGEKIHLGHVELDMCIGQPHEDIN